MKVAISSLEPELDSPVDARFGRAPHLLVVDVETMAVDIVDNTPNQRALKGAGIGAAEAVAGRGAQAVLTGHLGPNAYRALGAAGITGYEAAGMTVREAVDRFRSGTLERLSEGEAHAGL